MSDQAPKAAYDDVRNPQPIAPVTIIVGGVLGMLGFFAASATCAYGVVTVNKAVGWTGFLGMVLTSLMAWLCAALEVDTKRGVL